MTPHDLDARPGAACPGCPTHPENDPTAVLHSFLIVAARDVPGAYNCGHYHAEHCSDDEQDARELKMLLSERHGSAMLSRRDSAGHYQPWTITGHAATNRAPCCAPSGLPFDWNPDRAARCSYCGDPWTNWTVAA